MRSRVWVRNLCARMMWWLAPAHLRDRPNRLDLCPCEGNSWAAQVAATAPNCTVWARQWSARCSQFAYCASFQGGPNDGLLRLPHSKANSDDRHLQLPSPPSNSAHPAIFWLLNNLTWNDYWRWHWVLCWERLLRFWCDVHLLFEVLLGCWPYQQSPRWIPCSWFWENSLLTSTLTLHWSMFFNA